MGVELTAWTDYACASLVSLSSSLLCDSTATEVARILSSEGHTGVWLCRARRYIVMDLMAC